MDVRKLVEVIRLQAAFHWATGTPSQTEIGDAFWSLANAIEAEIDPDGDDTRAIDA